MTSNASANAEYGNRCVITGRMSSPLCNITVILYHVSYISRPYIPLIVSIPNITVFQSIAISASGIPNNATFAP